MCDYWLFDGVKRTQPYSRIVVRMDGWFGASASVFACFVVVVVSMRSFISVLCLFVVESLTTENHLRQSNIVH